MTLSVESAKTLVTKALDSVLIDPRIQPIMRTRRPLSITIHKLGPIAFHDEEVHGIGEAMETKLRGQAVKIAFLPIVAGETIAAFGPPSQGRAMPGGRGFKALRGHRSSVDDALGQAVRSARYCQAPKHRRRSIRVLDR